MPMVPKHPLATASSHKYHPFVGCADRHKGLHCFCGRAPDRLTQKELVHMSSRPLTALASVVLTGLGLLVLLPDCASACSCASLGSQQVQTKQALSYSAAVFSGEVVDVGEGPPIRMMGSRLPSSRATLQISKVWKAPEQGTLEVTTPVSGSACGYPFKEGQEYLVYADGRKGLKVDLCSETKLLSKAGADLTVLAKGEKPKEGGDASPTHRAAFRSARW